MSYPRDTPRRRPLAREVDFEDTIEPIGPMLRWRGRLWWPIRGHWILALLFAPLNLVIAVVMTGLWLAALGIIIVHRVLSYIAWVIGNT